MGAVDGAGRGYELGSHVRFRHGDRRCRDIPEEFELGVSGSETAGA